MSLKAFHIFFILCSVLLGMGIAAWQLQGYFAEETPIHLILAGFSFTGGMALAGYLFWFFQKIKRIGPR